MVDLRSDTLTQPTPEMRRAIADAEVGDEQKREDPTVIALEERAAELLGHEEAVFLATATMANQIALRTLTEPGDEVLAEEMAHVFRYELGGPAVHSGLVMKSLRTANGIFTAEDVRESVNPPGDLHTAPTRLVCIENTHNGGGGRVWPLAHLREVVAEARQQGLSVHLDGARLMNAAVASGTAAADYGCEFDTVTLCLSKGLGCPLGAVIAGSHERMAKGRRFKQLFGGAMRQAGIVAAAGLYACDHHIDRQGCRLDGGGGVVALFAHGAQQGGREAQGCKGHARLSRQRTGTPQSHVTSCGASSADCAIRASW